jgi:chaperone required for assembly of F1-ATPase
MSDWAQKRFWTNAAPVAVDGGYTVHLDGRPIKTPAKAGLILPTQAMAQAVAGEWNAQDGKIKPLTMPVTRSANAAIDKVSTQFAEVADLISAYGDSDLLCYRAAYPDDLTIRQAEAWDPYLNWAKAELNAALVPVVGLMHVAQPKGAVAELTRLTHGFSAFELAAMHDLVSLSGSLVLGFAAAMDRDSIEEIWKISRLDEIWQQEQWGEDDEANAMAAVKGAAFAHAKFFFDLCRSDAAA